MLLRTCDKCWVRLMRRADPELEATCIYCHMQYCGQHRRPAIWDEIIGSGAPRASVYPICVKCRESMGQGAGATSSAAAATTAAPDVEQDSGEPAANAQDRAEPVANAQGHGEPVANAQGHGESAANAQDRAESAANARDRAEPAANVQVLRGRSPPRGGARPPGYR